MRTHVLLLFGGESSEHDVSLKSAANVFAALDDQKYSVSFGYIDRHGKWYLVPGVDEYHLNCPQLVPVLGMSTLVTVPEGTTLRPDVVLPILHGANGEDGTVQGLAKLLHVPMVGPSLIGAALTMDKDLTKTVLRASGVPVADWHVWFKYDSKPSYKELTRELGQATLFVKPACAGSSVGVSKVASADELGPALALAAESGPKVIIEPAVEGREVEVAVLGNEQPSASQPGEIKLESGFYDYKEKYDSSSNAQVVVPAELEEAIIKKIRDTSSKAYRVAAGHGMARVDFLVDGDKIYVNEINSIPGFTNISMYPKLWRERGLSYPALLDRLIELALE